MSIRRGLVGLGVVLLCGACATTVSPEPWVYGLSREFYPHAFDGPPVSADSIGCEQAVVILAIFAMPFVLDTVFLPVTIPHDCLSMK